MATAAGSTGSTGHASGPGRVMTVRNVAFAVLGVVVFLLKTGYDGPYGDVVNAYAGNVAVSFSLYFAAINATARYPRPRLTAAALTLLAVALFEVTDGFGVMENVYDPGDLVADAAGVGLAVLVDIATERVLRRRPERRRLEPRSG